MPAEKIMTIPMLVWSRLSEVRRVRVEATDPANGLEDPPLIGTAGVTITESGPATLEWEENGAWEPNGGNVASFVSFHNRLRWTLHLAENSLSLSHLRQGADHPAWLCEFVPVSDVAMRAREPHRCGDDVYAAELLVEPASLVIQWRVEGPRKDQRLVHRYS